MKLEWGKRCVSEKAFKLAGNVTFVHLCYSGARLHTIHRYRYVIFTMDMLLKTSAVMVKSAKANNRRGKLSIHCFFFSAQCTCNSRFLTII